MVFFWADCCYNW